MQIGHRKSEDLDFMMWRRSKTEKPEIDWPTIERELTDKVGEIESFNMLGFDQVEFVVAGVKFSFYVSNNYCPVSEPVSYMGNIRLADVYSIIINLNRSFTLPGGTTRCPQIGGDRHLHAEYRLALSDGQTHHHGTSALVVRIVFLQVKRYLYFSIHMLCF
jgi:hypothetical protein